MITVIKLIKLNIEGRIILKFISEELAGKM